MAGYSFNPGILNHKHCISQDSVSEKESIREDPCPQDTQLIVK